MGQYTPADCKRAKTDNEEHIIADRRQHSWLSFINGIRYARRKTQRRYGDGNDMQYVDIHGSYIFTLAMIVMLLCVFDTFFTLVLIEHGAYEANPIMDYFLQQGSLQFFLVKYSITALAIILVVSLKHFRLFHYIKGSHILVGSAVIYISLIYHQFNMFDELVMR